MPSLLKTLGLTSKRPSSHGKSDQRRQLRKALRLETLEDRKLLTTAVMDGDWFDPATWDDGVPTAESRAIIGHGVRVELDGADHVAKELVVHGDLVVPEDAGAPGKDAPGRLDSRQQWRTVLGRQRVGSFRPGHVDRQTDWD